MTVKQIVSFLCCITLAALLWFIIFVVKPINFWLSMCFCLFLLLIIVAWFDRSLFSLGRLTARHLIIGITSAIVLYFVFYIGNILSSYFIPMKNELITSVYTNKLGTNPLMIAISLLLVIGPGEEIFWRGYVQKTLATRFGVRSIVIGASLYAFVHIVTLNLMLIIASLLCGLFWGAIYYKEKSLYPVIISHALWDVAVFLLFPFI